MRKGPKQVISKLLSLFAEEAVGKLLRHPQHCSMSGRVRGCHSCCRVFHPSMLIDDLNAPLNDAIEANPGTRRDGIHACLEAVRHAVKSCARCTGSPYALVSAKTNRNDARDRQYRMIELSTIPIILEDLSIRPCLFPKVSPCDAQIKPHRLAADVINTPSCTPAHPNQCTLSLQNFCNQEVI